jgi:hypothetical protein
MPISGWPMDKTEAARDNWETTKAGRVHDQPCVKKSAKADAQHFDCQRTGETEQNRRPFLQNRPHEAVRSDK